MANQSNRDPFSNKNGSESYNQDKPNNSDLNSGQDYQDDFQDESIDYDDNNPDSFSPEAKNSDNYYSEQDTESFYTPLYGEEKLDVDNENPYADYGQVEEEDNFKKYIIPLAIIVSVLFILIIFFILRVFGIFKKDDAGVQFEKETGSTERSMESLDLVLGNSDETTEEKTKVTVSVRTTPSVNSMTGPGLTTVERTKVPTSETTKAINISEKDVLIPTTTQASQTTAKTNQTTQTNAQTTTASQTTTTQQPSDKTTTTQTATSQTSSTGTSPTGTTTKQTTTEHTTTEQSATEQTTTEQTTTEQTTKPSVKIEISFPEPIQEKEGASLPESGKINHELPETLNKLKEGTIANRTGSETASLIGDTSFEIKDSGAGMTYTTSDLMIDKILAFDNQTVYLLSSSELYAFNRSNSESELIENQEDLDLVNAEYYATTADNLLIYSNNNLYVVDKKNKIITLLAESVSNIKTQANMFAFLHDGKIKFMDISQPLTDSSLQELSEESVSRFDLALDGSSLIYEINNDIYIYKEKTVYPLAENIIDFILTNDPSIIVAYTENKELLALELTNQLEVLTAYEDVNAKTLSDNQLLNYGGSTRYANISKFLVTFEDGSSQEVQLR